MAARGARSPRSIRVGIPLDLAQPVRVALHAHATLYRGIAGVAAPAPTALRTADRLDAIADDIATQAARKAGAS